MMPSMPRISIKVKATTFLLMKGYCKTMMPAMIPKTPINNFSPHWALSTKMLEDTSDQPVDAQQYNYEGEGRLRVRDQ